MLKYRPERKRTEFLISSSLIMIFFIGYLFFNFSLKNASMQANYHLNSLSNLELQTKYLKGDVVDSGNVKTAINILKNGGETVDLYVKPLNVVISSAKFDFSSLEEKLSQGQYDSAYDSIKNIKMLVGNETAKKNRLIKTLQIVMAVFTLLLYSTITLFLVRRDYKKEKVETATTQESDGILKTISDGLFLLGRDYEIGIQQSTSLKEMFKREQDLEGNFFDFISQYVTQSDLNIAKDFLELLFGDRVKENLIKSLNPLESVEINITRRDGSIERRYLSFNFKRVIENDQLKHLLVSVKDITRQVALEKELEQAKDEQEAQIELLKNILHIDSSQLKAFFSSTEEGLNSINQLLEENSKKFERSNPRSMILSISQSVHKIKGDAAALGLHHIEFSAHDFETAIDVIKSNKDKITGKELLPLTTHLRSMFKDLNSMQTLLEKFSGALVQAGSSDFPNSQAASEESSTVTKVSNIIDTVSERNNVKVSTSLFGLDSRSIPEEIKEDIESIAIQLARNSIAHGAELVEQRLQQNKPEYMSLNLSLAKTSRGYELIVFDDGKGIDPNAVVAKAAEIGIADSRDLDNCSLNDCLKYIFHPSFSSKSDVDLDSGRGVGLGLVRSIVTKRQGKIFVKSEKGESCQFQIVLPAVNSSSSISHIKTGPNSPDDNGNISNIG